MQWIDTAPNYATGQAQTILAPALAAHPAMRVSTKAGYFTAATGADAVDAGVLTEDQAVVGHSLTPDYVRWQTGRNREQLGRERLDLVLLHNPERAHPGDRLALHRAMREAFVVLEEAVAAGNRAWTTPGPPMSCPTSAPSGASTSTSKTSASPRRSRRPAEKWSSAAAAMTYGGVHRRGVEQLGSSLGS
ncbi:aldo/keto reductase [Streptomyces sp. DT2A-34]|nr:aldo/keto reductase [Streptomyces sp. DT2A-34]MDO0909330.1 aldo/keto reductase [Streptomyces sp. DT2A-34]